MDSEHGSPDLANNFETFVPPMIGGTKVCLPNLDCHAHHFVQ